MFNVQDYLAKFLKLGAHHELAQKVFSEVVASFFSLPVSAIKFTYKDGIFILSCSPAIKNALFVKKSILMEEITKRGVKVFDIR
jgi:hypothetical protein